MRKICFTRYILSHIIQPGECKDWAFLQGDIKGFWILVSSTYETISRNEAAFVLQQIAERELIRHLTIFKMLSQIFGFVKKIPDDSLYKK